MKNALKRSLSFLLAIIIIFGSTYAWLIEVDFSGIFAVKASAANATSGTTGDCKWSLNGTVLTVSGNGEMENYIWDTILPWGTNITQVIINEGVTHIGDYAFMGCTELTSITLPSSLTRVGGYAFSGANIESVYITDIASWCNISFDFENSNPLCNNANLYLNDELVVELIFPDSMTTIKDYAFYGCESIKSITVDKNITSMGYRVFNNCRNLEKIYWNAKNITDCISSYYLFDYYEETGAGFEFVFGDDIEWIPEKIFSECEELISVTIPDSVIGIGDYAFYGCEGLTTITIPDSVTSIGKYAFCDCKNLISTTIPDSVMCIGEYAFYGCESLISITIPDSVTSIGTYAFLGTGFSYKDSNWINNALYINNHLVAVEITKSGAYKVIESTKTIAGGTFTYCEDLTSITIPDSVVSIGNGAFDFCGKLTSINVDQNNMYYSSLSGVLFDKDKTQLIKYPDNKSGTRYKIPDTVISIGDYAMSSCNNIETIVFSNILTNIGEFAISGCYSLESVTIPNSVKNICCGAFYDSFNLKWVDYLGTNSQWQEIYIEPKNDALTYAYDSRFYSPETPELSSVSRTASGVKIVWEKSLGGEKYIVYRKTSKSGWTRLGITSEKTFTDTKAKTGTTYYYTVKAQNEAGASGYNKTGLKIKFVAAPKLTKIANEASGVRVYWSKVSGADGYYLYRRVAGSKTWNKIATIKKGSTTSYLDKKASAGKTYEYIIKAYDGSTPSAAAAKVIKIERLIVPKLVSTSSSKTGITVKWGKVAGAEGYYVYRKTGSGGWTKIATVKGNTKVSFIDKSAKKGVTYTYTVKAYSGSYTSSYNSKGLKIKDKY